VLGEPVPCLAAPLARLVGLGTRITEPGVVQRQTAKVEAFGEQAGDLFIAAVAQFPHREQGVIGGGGGAGPGGRRWRVCPRGVSSGLALFAGGPGWPVRPSIAT